MPSTEEQDTEAPASWHVMNAPMHIVEVSKLCLSMTRLLDKARAKRAQASGTGHSGE